MSSTLFFVGLKVYMWGCIDHRFTTRFNHKAMVILRQTDINKVLLFVKLIFISATDFTSKEAEMIEEDRES